MFPVSLHLFCRVVDNYGDIGVCWRLARQLQVAHGLAVTLWVDDLVSFHRICDSVQTGEAEQIVQGVTVRHWTESAQSVAPQQVADVVVEAFACELPAAYIHAMARRPRTPVWINLEYLSAETWVESCHRLPSRHPTLPLTKHFFFPGFSSATGGLLFEPQLLAQRLAWQADDAQRRAFWSRLGVEVNAGARIVSLFCYSSAPVRALFQHWVEHSPDTLCVVPEGIANEAVTAFLEQDAVAGARRRRGNLTLHVLPFVDQQDYDRLLWSCDINLVRGEDSFVRAQLAGRPFVWQIYAQEEQAHLVKLEAFLKRYCQDLSPQAAANLTATWRAWNGAPTATDVGAAWQLFEAAQEQWTTHAAHWLAQLQANGDLAANLIQFAREIS